MVRSGYVLLAADGSPHASRVGPNFFVAHILASALHLPETALAAFASLPADRVAGFSRRMRSKWGELIPRERALKSHIPRLHLTTLDDEVLLAELQDRLDGNQHWDARNESTFGSARTSVTVTPQIRRRIPRVLKCSSARALMTTAGCLS